MPPWGVNRCLSEELSPLPPQGTSLVSRVKSSMAGLMLGERGCTPRGAARPSQHGQPRWGGPVGLGSEGVPGPLGAMCPLHGYD